VIVDAGLRRRVTWTAGGVEISSRTTSEERVVLDGGDRGAIGVRLPAFLGPARRVTWWSPDAEPGAVAAAHLGLGGLDLDPDAGSRAAEREAWIRAHPRLHTARRTASAAAGTVLSLILLWLIGQVALPAVPWPAWDLPSLPWPDVDLPAIPWPAIPWPDVNLPDLDLTAPDWMRTLAEYAKYVWPVLLAVVLARGEVRRRREQDKRKGAATKPRAEGRSPATGTSGPAPATGDGTTEAGAGSDDGTGRA
jgi:hypothetical protein